MFCWCCCLACWAVRGEMALGVVIALARAGRGVLLARCARGRVVLPAKSNRPERALSAVAAVAQAGEGVLPARCVRDLAAITRYQDQRVGLNPLHPNHLPLNAGIAVAQVGKGVLPAQCARAGVAISHVRITLGLCELCRLLDCGRGFVEVHEPKERHATLALFAATRG